MKWSLLAVCSLAWLTFQSLKWGRHVSPKRRFSLSGLRGVMSQNKELFITAAVRNPKHLSGFCWPNAGFFNVKGDGTYSYHCAFKINIMEVAV